MSQVEELAKAAGSVEYKLWVHMRRIAQGYVDLLNAPNEAQAKTNLKEIRAAATDLEKQLRELLHRWGCPPALIINVNKLVVEITAQRCSFLDAYWLSMNHYFERFVHSKDPTHKVKELTSLYYLVKDLAEVSENAKADKQRSKSS